MIQIQCQLLRLTLRVAKQLFFGWGYCGGGYGGSCPRSSHSWGWSSPIILLLSPSPMSLLLLVCLFSPLATPLPISTLRAELAAAVGHCRPVLPPTIHLANNGDGVVGFSLSFSSCTPFPPCEQLLVVVVWGAVIVSARPRHSLSHCPPCGQGLTAVVWV